MQYFAGDCSVTAAEIGTIISIIASAVAVYLTVKRAPLEHNELRMKTLGVGGDALLQYQTALSTASRQIAELTDQNVKLQDRVAELEKQERRNPTRFAEQSAKPAQLEIRVADLDHENALLRSWAGRLSRQLEFSGEVPVPFIIEEEKRQTRPLRNLDEPKDDN